jgi:hypothetical protein
MIWTIRDKNGTVYFYTADNRRFLKLNDATEYVASKFHSLKGKHDTFNTCFERNRKLKVIMERI